MAMSIREYIIRDMKQNMKPRDYRKIKERTRNLATLGSATMYVFYIMNKDKERGMSQYDFWNVENTIKFYQPLFPHVKALMVYSKTDSKDARRAKAKINGRLRTMVFGTWIAPHVHMCFIGTDEKSARDFAHYISRKLSEKGYRGRIGSISEITHKVNYLDYLRKQAEKFHQYGSKHIDFRKCLSVEKIEIYEPRS